MSPILTGVIASGISGHLTPPWSPEGAYDALATVSLSTATASVTFSGIPSGYKHLQIRGLARTTRSSTADGLRFEFNEDTSTNYYSHSLYGDGSTSGSYASANKIESWVIAANTANSSVFGGFVTDILDYSNVNKNTTIKTLTGSDNNGNGQISLNSGLWMNTNAISSIRLFSDSAANFMTYSSFALYGVK